MQLQGIAIVWPLLFETMKPLDILVFTEHIEAAATGGCLDMSAFNAVLYASLLRSGWEPHKAMESITRRLEMWRKDAFDEEWELWVGCNPIT